MNVQYFIAKLKLVTVEPILFLYMMIIFMELNALQELIFVKSCLMLNQPVNISDCSYAQKANQSDAVLAEATTWSKYNNLCLFFFTFIASFYVGSWSDHFGRKFPMLIPPIGSFIASIVNCVLSYFIKSHVAYFLLSSFISGITFGVVGIISTTFGYITDFTHEQSRTKRLVILESMTFIGATVGIYISGVFLKHVNFDYALNNFVQLFLFEGSVAALITLYVIFRIPSSNSESLQSPLSCLFKLSHVVDSFKTVFRFREDNKRRKVLLMFLALFNIYCANVVQTTLGYYFLKEINWSFPDYTTYNSLQFAVKGFTLLVGLPALIHFLSASDHFIAMLGIGSRIAGLVVFGLSTNKSMVYSCIGLFAFSEFPVPAIRSMLSKTVNADEYGKIFAFTTIVQNSCYLLGSFVLMTVFNEFSFHGLSFEIVAGLQAVALIIIMYLYLTRITYITMYETIENEDGSVSEICSVVAASESIN